MKLLYDGLNNELRSVKQERDQLANDLRAKDEAHRAEVEELQDQLRAQTEAKEKAVDDFCRSQEFKNMFPAFGRKSYRMALFHSFLFMQDEELRADPLKLKQLPRILGTRAKIPIPEDWKARVEESQDVVAGPETVQVVDPEVDNQGELEAARQGEPEATHEEEPDVAFIPPEEPDEEVGILPSTPSPELNV